MVDYKEVKGIKSVRTNASEKASDGRPSETRVRMRKRISQVEKVTPRSFDVRKKEGGNVQGTSERRRYPANRNTTNYDESWKERRERNEERDNHNVAFGGRERRKYSANRTDYHSENRSEFHEPREKYHASRTSYSNKKYADDGNVAHGSSTFHGTPRKEFRPKGEKSYNYRDTDNQPNRAYNRETSSGNFHDTNAKRPERQADNTGKYSQKKVLRYKEEHIDPTVPIRLNRFLSNSGVCSRRDADQLIKSGVVTVNGEVVTELGVKVMRSDNIQVKGKDVSIEDKIYVLMNKPKDCVTTADDPDGRKTVMDLLKGACPERIYPIGRLDRNTTGVLLLTNDGELASKITHPKFEKKKIYHVHLNKVITEEQMQELRNGIELTDGVICADAVEYADESDKKQVGIEIHSGKNRIVRRMFEYFHLHVVKLDRVYYAGLTKKNLRRGQWRFLTPEEVNILRMGAFE